MPVRPAIAALCVLFAHTLQVSAVDLLVGVAGTGDVNVVTGQWSMAFSGALMNLNEIHFGWPVRWGSGGAGSSDQTVKVPEHMRVVASSPPRFMSRIPGGSYVMGVERFGVTNVIYESVSHTVTVFTIYMDRSEITRHGWEVIREWGEKHGYSDLPVRLDASERSTEFMEQPVAKVSWHDCVKWCNARSEWEGLTPAYYTDSAQLNVYRTGKVDITSLMVDWEAEGYRLPTEAEWEKAARGGLERQNFPWGNTITGGRANYCNSGDPWDNGVTPVAYYNGKQVINGRRDSVDMANGYGLYDMAGNVAEWCWDRFGWIDSGDVRDPRGPSTGNTRVVRGGSWREVFVDRLYCSSRGQASPNGQLTSVGFRCVRRE